MSYQVASIYIQCSVLLVTIVLEPHSSAGHAFGIDTYFVSVPRASVCAWLCLVISDVILCSADTFADILAFLPQ